MKQYFAKYLPVEGEIKEGDSYFYNNTLLTCFKRTQLGVQCLETETEYFHVYCKKAKLFLCSRDIKVGDTVMYLTENDGYDTEPLSNDNINVVTELYEPFKVIGEILTPNIKEGQEFTEKEIQYLTIKYEKLSRI